MSDNDGVVYTKPWVVNLILDMVGFRPEKPLWKMLTVEPSCGEGSFLKEMAERVALSAERNGSLKAELVMDCVVSYDTNSSSVDTSRNAVAAIMADHGLPAEDAEAVAKSWVRCEDYLLAEPVAADFVVGNPPYVRATDIPNDLRKKYCDLHQTMTMGCDLYVAFIEHGLSQLKQGGKLCFICADRWLQNQYGTYLRRFVNDGFHIDSVVKMHDVDAFESQVSAYPAITLLDRGAGNVKYVGCNANFNEANSNELLSWLESDCRDLACPSFEAGLIPEPSGDSIVPLASPCVSRRILELSRSLPTLEDSGVKLGIGLATGRDSVFITDKPEVVEPERMLPVFNMRDWRRGKREKQRWLINPWNGDGTLIELSEWPRTKAYFENSRETLEKRHVAKKSPDSWYRTIDKPKWDLLGRPMLLFPDMAGKAEPVYSDGSKYPCHNCYWLVSDTWDLKVLGGLLMSEVAESFVDALGVKMRGGTLRFQAQYLRLIHVPMPESIDNQIKSELRRAFEADDRVAATSAALKAYGL